MNDEKLSMIADAAVELVHEAITPILEKLDRLKTDMIIKQAHNATRIAMLEERSGALTAELTAERQLTADQQAYIRKCQERIGMVERERDEMRDQILAWLDAALQRPTAPLRLAPSMFVRARRRSRLADTDSDITKA